MDMSTVGIYSSCPRHYPETIALDKIFILLNNQCLAVWPWLQRSFLSELHTLDHLNHDVQSSNHSRTSVFQWTELARWNLRYH